MIGWALFLLATSIPPINLYPEEHIQPKWMVSIWVVLLLFAVCLSKRNRPGSRGLPLAACMAVCYICTARPFQNSSVLAMHLCMLMPFVHQAHDTEQRLTRWFAWFAECLLVIVLLLSQCRTGYLCLLSYILFLHLPHTPKIRSTAVIMLALFAIASAFFMKTDSSQGRWFIMRNTVEIIKERPLTGHGEDGFRKTYMKQQAQYFMQNPESEHAWLADDIRHPLNEFLLQSVNWGIAGGALLLLLLFTPLLLPLHCSNKAWRQSLATICIFSFFSYPLLYPLTWFVILTNWISVFHFPPIRTRYILPPYILLFSFFIYKDYHLRRWGQISYLSKHGHPKAMMPYYQTLYPHFQHNPDFLYDYAIESFYATAFRQAYHLTDECRMYMSSYDLCLLQGDICMQLKEYGKATACYQEAHQMSPVRVAPLSGMLDVYLATGNPLSADSIRQIIRNKKIKIPSKEVLDIKRKVDNH